ncbi:nucleotide exchange factor Fes1-domain-containing protein [Cyathus striatus]|nr:nucleotide exchange factor Fes1-domain-containing protein [Cyathus striatus]
MQSLLRWSIENSTPLDSAPSDRPPAQMKDLDPSIIDMILGKPDSELMKEAMAAAVDRSRSEDDRVDALDNLEMLIEQIDNANNLSILNLWEPLEALVSAEDSTSEIKKQALWVIGTAIQNNPKAQDVYLSHNPLSTILSFLTSSSHSTVDLRSKAIYVLSGLLKHNAPAVEALGKPGLNGWEILRDSLEDSAITVRRKAIFLLSTLLIPGPAVPALHTPDEPTPEPIHDNSHAPHLKDPSRTNTSPLTFRAFHKHGIVDAVISAVTSPLPHGVDGENTEADADFEEKAVRLLHTYAVTCQGTFSTEQKQTLETWLKEQKVSEGLKELAERWSLAADEIKALFAVVA